MPKRTPSWIGVHGGSHMPPNCWVITSTINTPYGVIAPVDRYQQTLRTIHHIRVCDPTARVILIDNSMHALHESQTHELQQRVHDFLWVGDRSMNVWVNRLGMKGAGECHMLLMALNMITHSQQQYHRMFKISGRYHPQREFHVQQHDHVHKWCFKRRHQDPCGTWALHTRLWSMCGTLLTQTQQLLRTACVYHVQHNCTIEQALFRHIDLTRVVELDRLYCEGHIAPSNELIQD
jgi:hypothetical protein